MGVEAPEMTDLTKYRQYSEIAEQLIKIADKEQLAECARLLALNVAHYEMKYGAMLLEEILQQPNRHAQRPAG